MIDLTNLGKECSAVNDSLYHPISNSYLAAMRPPSTGRSTPVMKLAHWEDRNSTGPT